LEQVIHGTLRPSGAARQLDVSSRQLRRLLRRYKEQGHPGSYINCAAEPRPASWMQALPSKFSN